MNGITKIDQIATENCPAGESLVTRFIGIHRPKFRWYFIFGLFSTASMKQYLVLVTDKSYAFLQFGFFGGAPTNIIKFNRQEMGLPEVSKGLVNYTLKFKLSDGKTLDLQVSKAKGLGMNDKARELFLRSTP